MEEVRLDDREAERLGDSVGTTAWKVSRTKVHDGVKVGWIVDYVPADVLPFSTLQEEFQGSVLDLLLTHAEIGVDHADTELVPVALTRAQAFRLGIRTGAPALHFDEITCTAAGKIVNWCQAWLLPGHFRFVLRRR
jgi:DNA-binding GntR family transcriptional regulator